MKLVFQLGSLTASFVTKVLCHVQFEFDITDLPIFLKSSTAAGNSFQDSHYKKVS